MTPNVPMSLKRTMEFAKFIFDGPEKMKHAKYPIIIPVDAVDDLPKTTGNWKMISPEELVHAYLLKLKERIDGGCSEEEMQRWKKVALSYPAQFEVIAGGAGQGDDLYWEAWKNRHHPKNGKAAVLGGLRLQRAEATRDW